jgi:beta-galactosidase
MITKKLLVLILISPALLFLSSCIGRNDKGLTEREVRFNNDWKFFRDDVPGAEKVDFDDSAWRIVDLPHDYSIEDLPEKEGVKQIGPFSEESAGGISTGHVVGGTAWYRKHFTLVKADERKLFRILFDGVYMDSDVWLNGHHLGNHPYGYTAFSYDLTRHLRPAGEKNVIAVRVKNEGENSRWYSGSGIYRNVTLISTNPVHIGLWGNYITTPQVSSEKAIVDIETQIVNSTTVFKEIIAKIDILNKNDSIVSTSERTIRTVPGESVISRQTLEIMIPELWSTETPYLYTAVVQLQSGREVIDRVEENFGVRSVEFSPEKGLLLNGKSILLKGGCLHHDNGILGAAAFDRTEFRKVEIMKSNGFNALRTAHNPMSAVFLDACDQLGMLVINEAFDHWQEPKKEMDYHRFFDEWWEKDLTSMVLRDRNHPSVIIWSIGNEIRERADPSGLATAMMLKNKLLQLDNTRPVTQGVSDFWETPGRPWEDSAPVFALLDVHGYNYMWEKYESDHEEYPERIIIGTETFPMEALENWQMAEKHPYVLGDFVWTGMDYFGESGIGSSKLDNDDISFLPPWPWFNAHCGDISVLGYKKPQMFFRDVVWRNSPLEMLVHNPIPEGRSEIISKWGWPNEMKSWNWEGHEGTSLQVSVYSRNQQVRLELNGELIGIKDVSEETGLTAHFNVPFYPGELVATGLDNGIEVSRQLLKTSGKPFEIRILAERDTIGANKSDLAYFNIEVTDENGLTVPDAEIHVDFTIEGPWQLQAAGNDNPVDMNSFQQPATRTYRGRCQVIIRASEQPGEIVLKATSDGLKSGRHSVVVR